jgi:flagellar hook-length control protein FliK
MKGGEKNMAVLQSITPSLPNSAGPAILSSGNVMTGTGKQGHFGSVFSKVVETGNQSQDKNSGENPAVKSEAKKGAGTTAGSSAHLSEKLRQIAALLGREIRESLSVTDTSGHKFSNSGRTGKSENRKAPVAGDPDIMVDGDNQVDGTKDDDPARIMAVLGQMLNELKFSLKSEASAGEDDSKKVLDEKSLDKIAEKLDELKSTPGIAVNNALSTQDSVNMLNTESGGSCSSGSDRDKKGIPGVSGDMKVVSDSLLQVIDSLRQIVEKSDTLKSSIQANGAATDGSTAGLASDRVVNGSSFPDVNNSFEKGDGNTVSMEKMSELIDNSGVKGEIASNHMGNTDDKSHVLPAKDGTAVEQKVVSGNGANDGNANPKPAAMQAKAFERGEGPAFRATGTEQATENHTDKPDHWGNSGSSAGIEVTVKGTSSSANASGGNGDMFRKGEDNGKGNLKFAEVNIGMRSQGISEQTSSVADGMPDEPAKNISPEQIMTQVREKLAETPLKSDSGVISLKLHPDQLGELKVHIRLEDQKLKVEVIAENHVVKDALLQNINSLRETLSRHNLTMDKFNVLTAGNGGSNQQFSDGRHSAQTPWVNHYDRYTVPVEDDRLVTAKYLDQVDNSLVDVRF